MFWLEPNTILFVLRAGWYYLAKISQNVCVSPMAIIHFFPYQTWKVYGKVTVKGPRLKKATRLYLGDHA